ncbi:MAG: flagellar hook-associated protein FlgK [Rhodocyclaceae bacterium]|nr:flagellar hook-associated protein FlgK [Rhodocyclaceae bacterium]MCA4904900.1 flagellar hook-associated protein FlgK [Rhodocyclaceae bacterium]
MSGSVLNIGLTALNAAQAGLVTTGHNISNAGTAGYHRQRIDSSPQVPQFSGGGFFGRGVNVDNVRRAYSEVLDRQAQLAQTQASFYDKYAAQVNQINNLVADPAAGLSPAMQQFFRAVQDVAASPGTTTSRQALLSGSGALVSRFAALDQRLTDLRSGVNIELSGTIGSINTIASQIGKLNGQIATAAGTSAQQPNDLLDQRDNLVMELNKLVSAQVIRQSDGGYNVTIGTGQALVVGEAALTLAAVPNPDDPRRLDVGYQFTGAPVPIDSRSITGGSLGALLQFRSESLDAAQNALGRIAIGLGETFNAQHRLGQDLNGAAGGDFFAVGSPAVTPASGTTATIGASIVDVSALTLSDYRVSFSGTAYTVTRLSDDVSSGPFATLPQTVDGVTLAAGAGTPAAGNSWLVQPTRFGARDLGLAFGDPSLIAAAAPVRSQATVSNLGSATIEAPVVDASSQPPLNAALSNTVTITFNSPPTTFNVVDNTAATTLASNVTFTAGMTISYNGWSTRLAGQPKAADTLVVQANTGGRTDNRNALLLAGLQSVPGLDGGASTYQTAYSAMVGSIGAIASEVKVTGTALTGILKETKAAQQSLSGVNLEEEAANLIRFQQAYQAASKLISVSAKLFDSILQMN